MDQFERLPLPPPDDYNTPRVDERRLWIGNLDTRITEFSLLKLLQSYGELEKFDFLYHKNGPDKGKPRGYCFVTFNNKKDAEKALKCLDGKSAMGRRLAVKPAHADTKDDVLPKNKPTTLSKTPVTAKDASINRKIQTIEAKLKQMEHEATSSQEPKTLTTQPHRLTTLPHKHHATQPQRPHDRRPYDRTHKCGR